MFICDTSYLKTNLMILFLSITVFILVKKIKAKSMSIEMCLYVEPDVCKTLKINVWVISKIIIHLFYQNILCYFTLIIFIN